MKIFKIVLPAFLLLIFGAGETVNAQVPTNEIEIGYLRSGQIDAEAFSLSRETTIQIEGYAGLFDRMGNDLLFYGWIIDAKTRELVWSLLKEENDRFFRYRDSGEFSFDKDLTLPAGEYEVYYTAGVDQNDYNVDFDFGELLDLIFDGNSRNNSRNERRYSKFSMTLTGPESTFKRIDLHKNVDAFYDHTIASFVRAGDNEFRHKSFSVEKDVELNIRGIGEQYDGEQFDFAWIVNTATMEKVWPNDDTRFRKAGGGRKNKSVNDRIHLSEGNYTLYYTSDDSHSYDKWNVLPPYDPQFWGISIWTDEKDQKNVHVGDKSDAFVLKLNKARDNDYLTQAFKLNKDMTIRVYSLGERSGNYEMVDYGWIINADTHEKVWEFNARYSEYAGGGDKNRMVNEEIDLEEGNYIAYYITDGSHSYNDWNVGAPLMPDLWGLNILVEEDSKYFELVEAHEISKDNILAEIVRVRDNDYERRNFTLDKESKIRIYAIGEGLGGDMDDTAWIKSDETGRVVWEMTLRNTDHAGGARKNKLFDGTIILPEGDYTVYYETDGSHSYRDWNAAAPHDQEHYGVSVYLIK